MILLIAFVHFLLTILSILNLQLIFDHCLLADERWRNLKELDLYTSPSLPHPDFPATEDFSGDLSIDDIRHIAALHSSRFKAEQNERMRAYDDDDDVSISSDDSMASLDPSDPNNAVIPVDLSTEVICCYVCDQVFLNNYC